MVRKNKLTNSNILKPTHRVCISVTKIQTDTYLLIRDKNDKNVISSNIGVTFVKGCRAIYLRKNCLEKLPILRVARFLLLMLWSAIYHETGYTVQVYTCTVYPVVYTFSWSSKYKLSWYIPVLSLYVTDQLTYKFILIRNKYILVPYILSHDK